MPAAEKPVVPRPGLVLDHLELDRFDRWQVNKLHGAAARFLGDAVDQHSRHLRCDDGALLPLDHPRADVTRSRQQGIELGDCLIKYRFRRLIGGDIEKGRDFLFIWQLFARQFLADGDHRPGLSAEKIGAARIDICSLNRSVQFGCALQQLSRVRFGRVIGVLLDFGRPEIPINETGKQPLDRERKRQILFDHRVQRGMHDALFSTKPGDRALQLNAMNLPHFPDSRHR